MQPTLRSLYRRWVQRRGARQRRSVRVAGARHRRVIFEPLEIRSLLATLAPTGTTADVIYALPSTADSVFLEDDGTSGNGMLQLRSGNGTFDTTVFANPSGSLTVLPGNSVDAITVNSLPDLAATLSLGGPSSSFAGITIAGTVALGIDKNIVAFASGTIGFNGTSKLAVGGAGTISLTTARNITLSTTISGNSTITSVNGNITLSANQQATPTSGSFTGIDLDGSTIKSTGAGAIIMQAKGGDTGDFQYGVDIRNGTKITGGTGGLQITGFGGASAAGAQNYGVFIGGTSTVASATGPVNVQGTGGSGSGYYNTGVLLMNSGSAIKSTAGNVQVIGKGYGSGEGVQVQSSAQISAAGSGSVSVQGTAGTGSSQDIAGVDLYQGTISTSAGDIQIIGLGGSGTGLSYDGVDVYSSQVTAGGSGNINIQGTMGGALFSSGVSLGTAGSSITATSGTIQITGILNHGVGTAIQTSGGSISTAVSGGTVTLIGDTMSIHSSSSIGSASGTVVLRPQTAGRGIDLGSTSDSIFSPLGLSDSELDQVVAGALQIGDANTGPITISANITRSVATNTTIISGDDVSFSGGSLNTDGGNLVLTAGTASSASFANPGVDANLGAGSLSFGAGSDVILSVNGTTADSQYQQLNVAGAVNLTGASVTLFGTYAAAPGDTFVLVNNDGSDAIAGIFTGLPEGSVFSSGLSGLYQITYHGGDGNDVAITAISSVSPVLQATANDDTLSIKRNNANVDVTLNGSTLASLPFNSLSSLTINGLAGSDTLTIDLSAGNAIPPHGFSFNGGLPTTSPGDKLIITGGNQGSVTYNYTNSHDGSIVMGNYGTVNYTGLEPIVNTGTATDVVFNLPAGPNTVTLRDDGVSGNTLSRISASTIETTDFANPSGTLTINRGNPADAMTLNALPDFNAGLTLGAAAIPFASLTFADALTLAADKSLTAYASGTISLANASTAVATSGNGAVTLTTARNITLAAGAGISTVNGGIALSANQQTTRSNGSFTAISLSGTLTTTGSGSISLAGTAGNDAATPSHRGVALTGGTIQSTGTTASAGSITVLGSGGAGTDHNSGIEVSAGDVESVSGNIQMIGVAGAGSTTLNRGITVLSGSQIKSTGTGRAAANITLTGTGGAGTDSNSGVEVFGAGTTITSVNGDISLSGSGGASASGSFNQGVIVFGGATVASTGYGTGTGLIAITGTGGGAGGSGITNNFGVRLETSGTTLASRDGDVSITGTAASTSNLFAGVSVAPGAAIQLTGQASLFMTGTGGRSGNQIGYGLRLSSGIAVAGPSTTLTGDTMFLDPANLTLKADTGTVVIQPLTAGKPIDLGTTNNSDPTKLGLSDANLDTITAMSLQIGGADSGPITISADITQSTDMTLTSGDAITFSGGLVDTSFLLLAPGPAGVSFPHPGVDANVGSLFFAPGTNLVMAINGTAVDTQYDQLNVTGYVELDDVNLVLSGTCNPAIGSQFTLVANGGMYFPTNSFASPSGNFFNIASGPHAGSYAINYDGGDGNDVVLTAINSQPTFTAGPNQTATDETAAQRVAHWARNISPGLSPVEASQQLRFFVETFISSSTDNKPLFTALPAIDPNTGDLTFTPNLNVVGTADVTVGLMDDGGIENGGNNTSDTQLFTIQITKAHVWHNAVKPEDVNGDNQIAPNDLTALISFLNGYGATDVPKDGRGGGPYCDVDADGVVAPKDLSRVIIYLNSFGAGEGERREVLATKAPPLAANQSSTDALFALLAADTASQGKRRS